LISICMAPPLTSQNIFQNSLSFLDKSHEES
jgi:hypothetical protein